MAKTLAIIAAKGGVGKTSCCVNLGGVYASQGAKVLLIDTDPQSSLSKFFLGTDGVHDLHRSNTVAAMFDDSCMSTLRDLVHETEIENLYLTPASDHLKKHNHPEPHTLGEMQYALREFVASAGQHFDFVIIDCPPDVANLPTWASLLSVEYALAPILPERFSIQSIAGIDHHLGKAREVNNKLTFIGYFLTQKRSRLGLHEAIEGNLRGLQGDRVLETVIPQAVAIAEAQQMGKPITLYDDSTPAAALTAKLAAEVLDRMTQGNEARRAA